MTKSHVLFETLLATAADGIMFIDENGTVQLYNPACEKLFHYAAQDVIGQNVKMLMPEPYHSEHDRYLQSYKTTGNRRIIGIGREVVGRRKDGSVFPMYLSVGEGVADGKPVFVGIVHDRTEMRARDRSLIELQQELTHVTRLSSMDQLASSMAHELNQPLTAITNYLSALRRTLDGASAAQTEKAVSLIDKTIAQAQRAGHIIRRLRDFVEKRESSRTIESINKIAEDAIALGLFSTFDTDVVLRTKFAQDLPPVLVDRVQIQQVMVNLMRNAVEAMGDSPRRELSVSTSHCADTGIEVSVTDAGQGIPEDVMDRLFKPFVTTKEKGMGIGLTICKSIIEAHEGHIWATPNPGTGTTFHFLLPAAAGF